MNRVAKIVNYVQKIGDLMNEKFLDKARKLNLVVFTKYFGYNFTGATITTHELVNEWKKYFNNITIITKNVGEYDIEDIDIIKCKTLKEMLNVAINFSENENNIFYSDDHIGFVLGLKGIKYHHTYHASWPDAKYVNTTYFFKSFGFIPLYKLTLKLSKSVIAVSYYSRNFVKKINPRVVVIRNGIGLNRIKKVNDEVEKNKYNKKMKCIMIGNIDSNKYLLAKQLFKKINKQNINIDIDIYGKPIDENLSQEIEKFSFVTTKGFRKDIDLSKYDLMISTSKFENLSIAVCEAIDEKVPVVSFDVGGLNEVILNGENGFLIKKYDIDDMLNILKIISQDRDIFDFDVNSLELFKWELAAKMYVKEFILRRI